jgi:hypothetical protein
MQQLFEPLGAEGQALWQSESTEHCAMHPPPPPEELDELLLL